MAYEYWLKQSATKPLFPNLIWSKPENKLSAGKLLIFGGSSSGFTKIASAFQSAQKSNIGQIRVLLPDVLQRTLKQLLPEASFLASNPSGGLSTQALDGLIEESLWADGVLLPGDLGHNSETEILLEKFIDKYEGELLIANDTVNIFYKQSKTLLSRPHTTLVLEIAQLQNLIKFSELPISVKSDTELPQLVEALHKLSTQFLSNFIVKLNDNILVASKGKVSSTGIPEPNPNFITECATKSLVWLIQNPTKIFEALSSAMIE